jgi:glycerol-3-phosphate acyltransferase PlsY
MTYIIIAVCIGYFLGSIPFGLVLAKLSGYGDIRKIGSGNIGATNVLRTGNKFLALATLILDGGKGAAAVFLTSIILPPHCQILLCESLEDCDCINATMPYLALAGLFSIFGHLFPIWLKFKGGKGVATTLGMLLALAPTIGVLCCALWLLTALIFRFSSLSALVAILCAPALSHFIYQDTTLTGACAVITLLVWFKHRSNIQRLIEGKEPKIGKKT